MSISELTDRVHNFRDLWKRYSGTRNAGRIRTQLVVLQKLAGATGSNHPQQQKAITDLRYLLGQLSRIVPPGRPSARVVTSILAVVIASRVWCFYCPPIDHGCHKCLIHDVSEADTNHGCVVSEWEAWGSDPLCPPDKATCRYQFKDARSGDPVSVYMPSCIKE